MNPELLSGNELSKDYIDESLWMARDYFRSRRLELMNAWRSGSMQVDFKADNSPFTELDRDVEQGFKDQLRTFDRSIGFIGEEYGREGSTTTCWLVDPIDGTRSFVNGEEGWTNMATLVHDRRAVAAVIYNPVADEMYTATAEGAFLNGEPLVPQTHDGPSRLFVDSDHHDVLYPAAAAAGFEIVPYEAARNSGARWIAMAQGQIDAYLALGPNAGTHDLGPLFIPQQAGVEVKTITPAQGPMAAITRLQAWDAFSSGIAASRFPADMDQMRLLIAQYRRLEATQ